MRHTPMSSEADLWVEGGQRLDVSLSIAVPHQLILVLLDVLLQRLPDAAAVTPLGDGPGELVIQHRVLGQHHPVNILDVFS